MRWYPSKNMIKDSWEKYSLIVIGNIVFFLLLYFISYRPNNDENRAAEFLSMAQEQETVGRNEAAMVLYEKVSADYPDSRARETAVSRLPVVKQLLSSPVKQVPVMVEPRIDLSKMLDRSPSVYMAAFLAEHYNDDPSQTPKIREALDRFLWVAVNHEGIPLASLQRENEFQTEFFSRELFTIRPTCVMKPDWLYDDFLIKNTNFFAWTNVNIKLTVKQGDEVSNVELRIPRVDAGETVNLMEMWTSKTGGEITCTAEITAVEGATRFVQTI